MSAPGPPAPWRALITVTTCRREPFIRRSLPQLARASAMDSRFSVLVSHDGDDAPTRSFCETWAVPLLHSQEQEGVGISKNRVLERFPDFDYYFFLEDDAELIDGSVFAEHITISQATGIHHLSLFQRGGIRRATGETRIPGHRIIHSLYGSADFNFFTRAAIERVGGWHPLFAKYRRWGHTEHSYRLRRAGLAPEPFNVAVTLADAFAWHAPPSVTSLPEIRLDKDQISPPERELMSQELTHVPVQTLSDYQSNGVPFAPLTRLAAVLDGHGRYPLLTRAERRMAQSDYLVWRSDTSPAPLGGLVALAGAAALAPSSLAVRHAVKTRLRP